MICTNFINNVVYGLNIFNKIKGQCSAEHIKYACCYYYQLYLCWTYGLMSGLLKFPFRTNMRLYLIFLLLCFFKPAWTAISCITTLDSKENAMLNAKHKMHLTLLGKIIGLSVKKKRRKHLTYILLTKAICPIKL